MSAQNLYEKLMNNIRLVINGKDDIIEKLIISSVAYGHVLLEDVPGTGKTTLTKAFAKSIGCGFSRVQFTPDLLPSDITGVNIYNRKTEEFMFKKGPIFTNILLADEINRATPKTQSSLLECMEERQVTVDSATYAMDEPFLVVATQNPIETQGTYPLPEAQLDRFLMRLSLGYPQKEAELSMLTGRKAGDPLADISAVSSREELIQAHNEALGVSISDDIGSYILNIIDATRNHANVRLGASPRAAIAMMRAAQATAAVKGRGYVLPDDVKSVAVSVLAHRIMIKGINILKETNPSEAIIASILDNIEVPAE